MCIRRHSCGATDTAANQRTRQVTAREAREAVEERCVSRQGRVASWCALGYEGALCSNCIEGYARGGIDRTQPCSPCGNPWPWWVWMMVVGAGMVIFVLLEKMLMDFEPGGEEENEEISGLLGVALIIGALRCAACGRGLQAASAHALEVGLSGAVAVRCARYW
jgi:hypothetical protein